MTGLIFDFAWSFQGTVCLLEQMRPMSNKNILIRSLSLSHSTNSVFPDCGIIRTEYINVKNKSLCIQESKVEQVSLILICSKF